MKLGLRLIRGLSVVGFVLGSIVLSGAAARSDGGQRLCADRQLNIDVQGNRRVEAATIRSYFKPGPDGRLGPYQIDEGYKTLYNTGLFMEISIRNVGGRLIVTVVENPVINRIQFEGNSRAQGRAAQDSKYSPRNAARCCARWSRTTCSGS